MKTAVVLVHGIGEQRPMDTLWSFIDAAWSEDRSLVASHDSTVYSKPAPLSDSYELRRVTTRSYDPPAPRRVDFFEFYWAHLMTGNTLSDMTRWIASLFLRSPWSVPRRYLGYWCAAWLIGIAATAIALVWILATGTDDWWAVLPALLGPAVSAFVAGVLVPRVGDAARYLRPLPDNVEARQRIRSAGIDLLQKLTASRRYDRIVLVGHSLGSVIAYDILTHAWSHLEKKCLQAVHGEGSPAMTALTALEAAGAALCESDAGEAERQAYRNAQRAYRRALAGSKDPPWLVSDLVTLGSPLAKADLLLAQDAASFARRKERREFPTAPPVFEYWARTIKQFSYPRGDTARIPHHAAPFAPTVWTNLYVPTSLLLFGDPISGPVAPHFGPGVRDIRLPGRRWRFQHLHYWHGAQLDPPPEAVRQLRAALNLRDRDEAPAAAGTEQAP